MADNPRMPVERVYASANPDVIETFEKLSKGSIGIVNIHRTLANSPAVFARFIGLAHALRFETALDPAERELAILRALHRHGGDYEIRHHARLGAAAGLSAAQIEGTSASGEPADLYDARHRAVLRFAERFAAGKGVPPEEAGELAAHFDDRQRTELALTLALYVGLAHLTSFLDVPVD